MSSEFYIFCVDQSEGQKGDLQGSRAKIFHYVNILPCLNIMLREV